MPRNFQMVVTNLRNQTTVSKPEIFCCACAIPSGPAGGLPKFLTFFAFQSREHTSAHVVPPAQPLQTSSLLLIPYFRFINRRIDF